MKNLMETRLKVDSVLDREPKNYSNLSSFSNHSNSAELFKFFHVFIFNLFESMENFNMNEIIFLSASKNILCAKSIYFMSENEICQVNLFLQKAKNKSIYSRITRNTIP